MDVEMKMPDLATIGPTVKVLRWLAEVGQVVRRGEPLLEVETDKAVMVVESAVAGTLKAIRARPDQEVPSGEVLAVFEAAGSPVSAPRPEPAALPAPASRPAPAGPSAAKAPAAGSFFARNRGKASTPEEDAPGSPGAEDSS